jgi:uncharacterized coiled-coil protein SlyX
MCAHRRNFTGNTDDPIVQKIVNRLQRAIVSDEIRRKMDFEDDFYGALEDEYNKGVAEEAAKKDIIIAEKDQVIVEKEQALVEKDQALENERQKVELLMQQLAELQKKNKK